MNKNDKTILLAKYFIWYYLYLFLGVCKCNMRNIIIYKFWNGIKICKNVVKRDLFAMKERDLKFNKNVKISLSVANLRNQAMSYGSLFIYLRHILIILSEHID